VCRWFAAVEHARCHEAQLYMMLRFTSLRFTSLPLPLPLQITSRKNKEEESLCTFASMMAHVMLCVLRR
jgi:hypothetical protein